jgi:hypothetical protein
LPKEVYGDPEFNDLDFGTLVEEVQLEEVKSTTVDAVMAEIRSSGSFTGSVKGSFVAPHRSRPLTKIALSNDPTGESSDQFGTRILDINLSTPHLEQVLLDTLEGLMREFIEGKASIKNIGNAEMTFVNLSDSLVDCEPNEIGLDSWFDVLHYYTPLGFLENLAKLLMAVYEIDVSVIPGKGGGLVLRRESAKT